MTLKGLFSRALDILWPKLCIFCRRVPEGRGDLCARCAAELPLIAPDRKLVSVEFTEGCACALRYEGGVRDAVHRFKYGGAWHYARHFSALMAANIAARGLEFDAVTFVPITGYRRAERGYNQAEELARGICRRLDLPPPERLLRKVRETRQQAGLTAAARRGNVLGAFRLCRGANVVGLRILLVDDVLTTGATLGECARMLLYGGAEKVICATLARSDGTVAKSAGEKANKDG